MIKINLLAEKKKSSKSKTPSSIKVEGAGRGQNLLLVGILLIGIALTGVWWWRLSTAVDAWAQKHREADAELERLADVRKKGDELEAVRDLVARKIGLITELKKRQAVPVHILDEVSKNLPDFLWLDRMTATDNELSISGKATSYNAVSNFYGNLTGSGHFGDVSLGRVFEVNEGVAFSLTCRFTTGREEPVAEEVEA